MENLLNFIQTMRNLLNRIREILMNVFQMSFEFAIKNSALAVKITDNLKFAVESPTADLITTIIPGDIDDNILKVLRKVVPEVAFKLGLVHKIVTESQNMSEAVEKIIIYLKEMHPKARTSFWVMFAAELNLALNDGKITLSEAIILSQMAYSEIMKKR